MSTIRSIRGMKDTLPAEIAHWHFVEDTARAVLQSYGYREIRTPILEQTELFLRSIGEVTDIVEKEMYTFEDKGGDSLTMRPECTAAVVRACYQGGLVKNQTQRLWYNGPMFRHERPQKGRYRQFHQIGAEAYGMPGPEVDAELILMLARLWREIGLPNVTLELNTLGSAPARVRYRAVLVEYLSDHSDSLDEDSRRRLGTNPLRVLDSKNPAMQTLIEAAPRLADHVDAGCAEHFTRLQSILTSAGVEFQINHRLVRGLDYYGRTVFEWTTTMLGSQGTVCGGGRYDDLFDQLGGSPGFGVGFSMGVERLVELLQVSKAQISQEQPDAFFIPLGDRCIGAVHPLAERLRDAIPGLGLVVDAEPGSAKAKFRRADKSGAAAALILGESELDAGQITFKPLREQAEQQTLDFEELCTALATLKAK
jgi:histidyl-tRNA synthetase